MHPGSPALHPLLCGGSSTTTSRQREVCCCFFFSSAASLPQQSCHVRSAAADQVPSKQGGCGCCEGRPQQAEKQAADLTNRRRTLPCSRPIRAQVRSWGTGAPHLVAAKGTLRAISGLHFQRLPFKLVKNLSMFENQTMVDSEKNI